MIIALVSFKINDSIFYGKKKSWTIFYDKSKKQTIIEIHGVKFGFHDYLNEFNDETGIIAKSNVGKLYKNKKGELYYCNSSLKFKIKLEEKSYTTKMDELRLKIFEIKAFNEINKLKDSLKINDYKFDWNVNEDFIYHKNQIDFPIDYTPIYIQKFYSSIK
jgi:hypothetical protein